MTFPRPWSAAELLPESTRIDSIERPTRAHKIMVPRTIELDDDRLKWDWRAVVHPTDAKKRLSWVKLRSPKIGPRGGVLDEFLQLAKQDSPQSVLRFAREWGVLGICEHDLPHSHNSPISTGGGGCSPRRCSEWVFWEPVNVWFQIAGHFNAILNIAAALHLGRKGKKRDWDLIKPMLDSEGRTLRAERYWLGTEIDAMLKIGDVRPTFSWVHHHPTIKYATGGAWANLFGYLALQLALAVSRTDGLATCSACGRSYMPDRRPNPDRRSYCEDCGLPAAQRDASRAYRAKLRQSRQQKH